jgi:hypothetical protein
VPAVPAVSMSRKASVLVIVDMDASTKNLAEEIRLAAR